MKTGTTLLYGLLQVSGIRAIAREFGVTCITAHRMDSTRAVLPASPRTPGGCSGGAPAVPAAAAAAAAEPPGNNLASKARHHRHLPLCLGRMRSARQAQGGSARQAPFLHLCFRPTCRSDGPAIVVAWRTAGKLDRPGVVPSVGGTSSRRQLSSGTRRSQENCLW